MFVTFLSSFFFFFCVEKVSIDGWSEAGNWEASFLALKEFAPAQMWMGPIPALTLALGVNVTSGLTAMLDLYFPYPLLPIHMSITAVGHACEGPCCLFLIVRKSLVIFWSSRSEPSKPSLCASKIARKMLEPNHTHGKIVTSTWIGGLWVWPEQNSSAPPGS